jgi:hypothetical protein
MSHRPSPGAVEALVRQARRIGPGPLLVRGGLFLAGLVAQLLAWPPAVTFGSAGLLFVAAAAAPMVAPRTRLVTAFLLSVVVGWLVTTTAYGEPVAYWRLVTLAASMYGVHTLAALAAVLPMDTLLAAGVLPRWLARAGVVVALTVVVALFTMLVPAYVGDHRYLLASLVGLIAMIGLAGYLAALVRTSAGRPDRERARKAADRLP